MIKFSMIDFNINSDLDNINNHLIIIENKKYLYNFLCDMYMGCIFKEYIKIYDEDYNQLKNTDYIDFIPSLINIDINNKKNINALIRYLKKICFDEVTKYTSKINDILLEIFNKIKMESPIEIVYDNTFSDDDLFRILNFTIVDSKESLLERIFNYISLSYELRKVKLFVFYSLSSFLDEEEMINLLKNCSYLGVSIINIENNNMNLPFFDSKKILDNDNCLIE